ncbi:FAD-binding and (Fe-S)-binding domain-containing protein [Halosolutus amylolyticus]|uniref:D-lactate dehydrogenase (cytochrome) n=1 Tax=Halosolutus amylolyticus TaxID=2932267 RepID=A0ABD5PR99_9EURY|nr:FAD-binding and (Fe-S)-binding domain-containing protein [Halosolutus amylolyticus]
MSIDSEPRPGGPRDLAALDRRIDGDVDASDATRALYATDASIYRVEPAGVVWPADRDDVREIVRFAHENNVSLTARGAGSSLTGNAIGEGLVVECTRYLNEIVAVDPERGTATVQPGVVLDDLNAALADHDLYFPPDPSTSSTCTIGGMVANDAAGPHSVRHGTTRENVAAVECVLADGSLETFEHRSGPALERARDRDDRVGDLYRTVLDARERLAEEIDERYPDVERNSSGYDLQAAAAPDGSWADLSQLLVGSEGTLGFIVEVTIEVTERPSARAAALCFYDDVVDAAAAVVPARAAETSAIELVDDAVLGYARDAWGIDLVPEAAGAALLIEVEGEPADLEDRLDEAVAAATTADLVGVERAMSDEKQDVLWKVRKASNPLLNRRPGDEQALSFVEDAAVPPERLPEYLERIGDVLREHDLEASVFGHAGQGVLHVKPFLDLSTEADRERLQAVSATVHELVLDLGGCVSGEHGDGRLRSQYLPQMYGEDVYETFCAIKRAADPRDVFNPAKVVPNAEGNLASVTEDLRFEGYDPQTVETALDFTAEGGFGSLVEQCNGCSKCRSTGDGVMCPSYRAADTEVTSTRGRANMLREAIDGELGEDALTSDWFQEEVLDRCLACKACETECPTGVDMAKLKTEAKHRRHQEHGVPLRSRLFGNVRTLNRLGSALAPLANRLATFGPGRVVAEKVLGIDRRRSVPRFAAESFPEWVAAREPAATAGECGRVVLYPDCYTAYNHPQVGKAAVRLLEALGYAVEVPAVNCCGRPALSQGMVERTRADAAETVDVLADYVDDGVPVLAVEPSCASALVEYDDLLEETAGVPDAAATVSTFLYDRVVTDDLALREAVDGERVAFHGHCHETTRGWDHAPIALLREVGYEVEPVAATCCGMAGSFGYETEHYGLSTTLGADLVETIEAGAPDVVAATGASCSQQLGDFDVDTRHPVELLAEAVV